MDICNLEFSFKSLNFIDHWVDHAAGDQTSELDRIYYGVYC